MTKIGVYVDSMNIVRNGGYGMRYEVLRRFATRNGGQYGSVECLCGSR